MVFLFNLYLYINIYYIILLFYYLINSISYDKCTKCNEEENRIFNERTRNCDCKIGFTEAKLNPDLCVKCYSF